MRMIHAGAATAAFFALVLAGCSSGPEIAVTSSGTMPTGGAYAIVEGMPGDVGRSVSDVLAGRGLTQSVSPDYIVQVSYAERPAGTGLLVPGDADTQWLRPPDFHRNKRPIATLGISLSDAIHGHEIYRASASGDPQSKDDAWVPLLKAIFPAPAQVAD